MNFTWFASAYDNDDVAYRLIVFVQIDRRADLRRRHPSCLRATSTSASRSSATSSCGWPGVPLAARVGRAPNRRRRTCAPRYAIGITVCQIGWIAMLALPGRLGDRRLLAARPLRAARSALGRASRRARPGTRATSPSATGCSRSSCSASPCSPGRSPSRRCSTRAASTPSSAASSPVGLLLVFSMWWLYFDYQVPELLTSNRVAFRVGLRPPGDLRRDAAVGAGLVVAVDHAAGHGHVSDVRARDDRRRTRGRLPARVVEPPLPGR